MQRLRNYTGKDADGIEFEPAGCATILAPGPSLLKADPDHNAITIGINGAVKIFQCSIWACYDKVVLSDFEPLGNPVPIHALPTMHRTQQELQSKFKGMGSIGLGIAVAWHLGALDIKVYGADWCGGGYAFGENPQLRARLPKYEETHNHPKRWEKERRLFGALKSFMAELTPAVSLVRIIN